MLNNQIKNKRKNKLAKLVDNSWNKILTIQKKKNQADVVEFI